MWYLRVGTLVADEDAAIALTLKGE